MNANAVLVKPRYWKRNVVYVQVMVDGLAMKRYVGMSKNKREVGI